MSPVLILGMPAKCRGSVLRVVSDSWKSSGSARNRYCREAPELALQVAPLRAFGSVVREPLQVRWFPSLKQRVYRLGSVLAPFVLRYLGWVSGGYSGKIVKSSLPRYLRLVGRALRY